MTSTNSDVTKLDLYDILGIDHCATEKQILKAYRKKALKCHPDKNLDNPNAAEEFHLLSKALEVLTDVAAKEAYDKIQKAKKAAEKRHRELDSKRKKLKEDLEARESLAAQKETEVTANRKLNTEIERLRKEGSKLLEREQILIKEQMRSEFSKESAGLAEDELLPRLKVKWKVTKDDNTNAGYSYENLHRIFSKHGDVIALVMSSRKKGSALVEFQTVKAAKMAVQNEFGNIKNPLTITWVQAASSSATAVHKAGEHSRPTQPVTSQERDYESLVLRKLRQAEERKRLIAQISAETDGDT